MKYIYFEIPKVCPICGEKTIINSSHQLYCQNQNCNGKLINKLDHFCGKKGLDIKGLSKATLEKLIEWEWVISIIDIYNLFMYKEEWINKEGFGQKSVDNILQAIEESKNCQLSNFLSALGIPLIGLNNTKEICKHINSYEEFKNLIENNFDFCKWNNFGIEKKDSLLKFDYYEADILYNNYIHIISSDIKQNSKLQNLKFCITGTLNHYKNRNELQTVIEHNGGKVINSISKNINYLINNNKASKSSKNIKAQQLNINIITEEEFINLFLTE